MRSSQQKRRGFTLMETVIAIGVLAVLLSAFMAVFGPAAAGIRRAISAQEADRLASTLERELGTLRAGQATTGVTTAFDKAFNWIKNSNDSSGVPSNNTLMVYQYKGNPSVALRADGTLVPYTSNSGIPGKDYIVQPMVRLRNDPSFAEDLAALEGRVFAVKATQLVFKTGALAIGTPGTITDPKTPGSAVASPTAYPEAVIAFSADFYSVQSTSVGYLTGTGFTNTKFRTPIFSRNLAVRR